MAGVRRDTGSRALRRGEAPALPPFVLVHGLASNARLWDGVAETLAATGHLAVTVDLRGHGRSSKPDGPYDVPTVADDLAALIERLVHELPSWTGRSWPASRGAATSSWSSRPATPVTIRGIVCVDGGLAGAEPPVRGLGCLPCGARPAATRRAPAGGGGGLRPLRPSRLARERGSAASLANFEVRPDGTVAPWLTYERHIEVLHGLWEHHPSEHYAGLAVPVLLVPADGGDADGTAAQAATTSRRPRATIPNARVRWFAATTTSTPSIRANWQA